MCIKESSTLFMGNKIFICTAVAQGKEKESMVCEFNTIAFNVIYIN